MVSRSRFPPVNSGGLIEAATTMIVSRTPSVPFPPVNSGGLIEAMNNVNVDVDQIGSFPPVNSGGLIEATPMGEGSITRSTCFRR